MIEAARLAFPLCLTIGEMAFLVSLTGVQQVVGLEQAVLLPSDVGERGTLLLAGRDSLLDRGLLRRVPETSRYDLNLELTAVITTVAAPDAVITTTLRGGGQPLQHVLHYMAGLPVEVVFDGEVFLLAGLASVDVMLARLANTLRLPGARASADEIALRAEEVKALPADPSVLSGYGVATERAQGLASALAGDGHQADVLISHVRFGQVVATSQLRVLALGTATPWMAVPTADRRVMFAQADQAGFSARLVAFLEQRDGASGA